MDNQNVRLDGNQGDRGEILYRVVGEVAVQTVVGGEDAVVAEQPGMAVGGAFGDRFGGEVAARAGAVLDEDLMAPALGELLAESTREDVARPARREADHEAHRLR